MAEVTLSIERNKAGRCAVGGCPAPPTSEEFTFRTQYGPSGEFLREAYRVTFRVCESHETDLEAHYAELLSDVSFSSGPSWVER
jgi:hypothetical protein